MCIGFKGISLIAKHTCNIRVGYFALKQYSYTSVYGACMPTMSDVVHIGSCCILCTMVAEQYGSCVV